jgi:hypothetical protein
VHTYRDREPSNTPGYALLGFLLFLVFSLQAALQGRFTWAELVLPAAVIALVVVGGYHTYRLEQYRKCREIRLSDDGTCELDTRAQTIRLHVSEIRAVKYHRDSESERCDYSTIYYRGGKLRVSRQMGGFSDFLMRLKTLNPAVELSRFPFLADAWLHRKHSALDRS